MKKLFNYLKLQHRSTQVNLKYTKVDNDTYEVNNGHSKFAIRVVTTSRVKQLENVKKSISSEIVDI